MKKIVALIILFITFGVYLYTTVPTITGDDSGELAGVCATLGIAHSPGYPVYSIVGKAIVTMLPFGNYVYRANLVSSIFIALTVFVIYFIIAELTGKIIISAAISLLFAFSKVVWTMANTTEVYGTSAFAAALMLYVIVRDWEGEKKP